MLPARSPKSVSNQGQPPLSQVSQGTAYQAAFHVAIQAATCAALHAALKSSLALHADTIECHIAFLGGVWTIHCLSAARMSAV